MKILNERIEKEIFEQKKTVDYDTREFTIQLLVQKYADNLENDINELYVPEYQREFVWDEERQSKFIESLILGLPIPLIFVAEHQNGRLEIVDGSQRIRTLNAFLNDELELSGLFKLRTLNGVRFSSLSEARQRKIKNTALRMIVLSEETTEEVRNDIFERINRGSESLKDMEKRKGIYRGKFNDFIYTECAKNETFIKLTPLSSFVEKRQEHEELILRFFALYDQYPTYRFTDSMGIARYLDSYLESMNIAVIKNPGLINEKRKLFNSMVEFVNKSFYYGFAKKDAHQVSRVYFEAIAVGSALALHENPKLNVNKESTNYWLRTGELVRIASGKYKTHSKSRILERIDYVKGKLLK